MRRFLAKRPTPAMAVAFVALLAALSGSAIALPGKNSVDSGDIKNNNIRSKDIRNNDVRSGDVRNSTLTGGDVKNDSLTGDDVKNDSLTGDDVTNDSLTGVDMNESTLGKVPSAAQADSATSATTASEAAPLKRWFVQLDEGQAVDVFNIGGIVLNASCADASGSTVLSYTLSGAGDFAAAGDDDSGSDGSPVAIEDPGATDAAGGNPDIQFGGYDATWIAVAGSTGLTGSAASWANADSGTCKAWGHAAVG